MTTHGQYETPTKKTKQSMFLEEFAKHGIVSLACKAAGVQRSAVYRWKEQSDTFLFRFNQAFETAKDNIRAEVYRRAHDGVQEPVWQLGKYCGQVTRYSDTLLIFHAKMLMPEYRDKQQVELTGSLELHKAKESLLAKLAGVRSDAGIPGDDTGESRG